MPESPSARTISFGPFQVNRFAGELRKYGVRIRLSGQPFEVLILLLERPGEVVTHEELRARLWQADTFVDFEHGLHAAVNKLREALGDSAECPRYIQTMPRRGYRFVGAVQFVPEVPRAPALAAAEKHAAHRQRVVSGMVAQRHRPVGWRSATLLGVILVLAAFGAGYFLHRNSHRTGVSAPPQIHSIAVLPLENLSGDPEQEYFADGMTEALVTDLGKISTLRVISRTSVKR